MTYVYDNYFLNFIFSYFYDSDFILNLLIDFHKNKIKITDVDLISRLRVKELEEYRNHDNVYCFHKACENGHFAIVKCLVEKFFFWI